MRAPRASRVNQDESSLPARVGPHRVNLLLIILLSVLCHAAFHGVRVTISLLALNIGGSAFTVGSLMALMAAFPTVFGVAAGRWTDRVGAKRPMLAGALLVLAGAALPAIVPELPALYVTAALCGTGMMATQVALQNVVGEMSKVEDRAANFSRMALGMSLSSSSVRCLRASASITPGIGGRSRSSRCCRWSACWGSGSTR